jgi:putative transposase
MPFSRRSLRLGRFDYGSPGAYFITVVVHQRRCVLGDVVSGRTIPNDAGRMVIETWHSGASRHPLLALDSFVVMPNHVHGIVRLDAAAPHQRAIPVPAVVGAFKSLTTRAYIHGVRTHGWPSFERHLWQRSYYDRVIRDDAELAAYREYIATNPLRWSLDREFPASHT